MGKVKADGARSSATSGRWVSTNQRKRCVSWTLWTLGPLLAAAAIAFVGAPDAEAEAAALKRRKARSPMADDAFGTSIGLERTGIYTDNDTRGFSPFKAGNVRFDGIYFDPIGVPAGRIRESSAIRVGFGAEGFPFQAPTGIVDYRFRPFPSKPGLSLGLSRTAFNGTVGEVDIRLPIIADHLSLTGGGSVANQRYTDGTSFISAGIAATVPPPVM